ncbi:hypothetical protein [uncultured Desulfovibrio sp.]|uniref:hypothetical protein n=1 Tax=uncultured Desulfovibrio sp. TaxID=167968 RepID=UPI002617D74F|nr:hypothetical protein [uncultured Desulfovibrio sp.]
MNTDIRLSVGFWQHPKTKKLARRLGLEAVRSLQILWLWAAQNRPDGNLSGMDWEDIELAADWQGEEQAFFTACLGAWIDEIDGGYVLHDWAEHNPWQAEAEARSDAARKAALARWGNAPASDAQCPKNADASNAHMRKQCARNAPASDAQCPSPFPSKKNINTNTPLSHTGNEEPARAREASQGSSTGKNPPSLPADEPGIEFVELRQFYSEHFRDEGALAGFAEFKQARASSQWPGFSRLYEHLNACLQCGQWEKGYAPGLARYFRERMWKDQAKPRASPGPDGVKPTRTHKQRMAILQAAAEGKL